MRGNSTRLALIFTAVVAVTLGSTLAIHWMGVWASGTTQQVIRSRDLVSLLEDAYFSLKEAEACQRGYLLTGEDLYLESYRTALSRVDYNLSELDRAGRAGELSAEQITTIIRLSRERLARLEQTIQVRREKGLDAAVAAVQTDAGKGIMDELRERIGQMQEQANQQVQANRERRDGAHRLRTIVAVATALVTLAFLLWAYRRIHEGLRNVEQTGAEAERQRQLLAVTLASIGDGVIVTDPQGRVTFFNGEAERLTGWKGQEACGQPLGQVLRIVDEKTGRAMECPVTKVLRSRTAASLANHTMLIARDGREIPIDHSGAPVRQADGAVHGVVLVLRDYTEQRRAQEALAAASISAEHAKGLAEEANRAKDHFLAVLSHELRTPLTPVVTAVAMLQHRPQLDPDTRETLAMIQRNVQLEARLIDDLLDVTRIARGKIELEKQRIELSAIIHRAVEVCYSDIEARGLQFGVDMGTDQPYWLDADPARLQQVFWNLLKNAIKFTPHGGCVGIRCRPDGQGHVLAEVNDSGIGIEREALPRLFNAFEQTERSITRQFGGLGLGLAICKALVEMHGGTISARSQGRGRGATFTVKLPVVSCQLSAENDRPALASSKSQPTAPLRILLVEDHGDTAKMMRLLLMSDGHQVMAAGDVATALKLVDQHPFDLLISDLGLPDGSGHDLMREVRTRGYDLPGIALSGYGQEQDIRRSHEAGFVVHLTKPTSPERLAEAIASATRNGH